jgi:hypothetical protein
MAIVQSTNSAMASEANMQPCPVCGGVTIDAAGRCTQCGTFRGQPTMGMQPQPPAGMPPPQQMPPPMQPYPYQGQPSGAPYPSPASGPPTSGAPMTSPVAYPGYPPQPPAQRRSAFVPLIAAVSAVVVLIAAIVVVLVVKNHRSPDPTPVAQASVSPSASTLVDSCVVGTWKVTSDQTTVDFGGSYGKISVTNTEPYTIKMRADGTAVEDMGEATIFQGEVNNVIYTVGYSGTSTYSYRTGNGQLTINGAVAKGHWVLLVNDKTVGSGETVASNDPVQYTCSGDTMTEHRTDDSMQMSRTSHDA